MLDRRIAVLLVWAAFFVLVLIQLQGRTTIRSDMTAFLPAAQDEEQRLLLSGLLEGPASRIWLMALDGETAEVLSTISKDFAYRLRQSGVFRQVINGEDLLDEVTREQLFAWRYLLNPEVDRDYFSAASLNAALLERLDDLGSPLSTFEKKLIPSDPTAAFMGLLMSLGTVDQGPEYYNGVWFTQDRTQALLLVETRAAGMDLDAQQQVHGLIKEQLNKASEGAAIGLTLTGAPLFALQSRTDIRQESQKLSLAASIFMLLFMAFVYRSPRRIVMTVLPLAGGILAAVACVSLLFGFVHGITLAFGVTLMGVAVDYPVHVLSHIRQGETVLQSVRRIWPTLRLGVMTTLLGYLAMSLTEFTGLAQLGVFSISGLLVAALVTRTLLPVIADAERPPEPALLGAVGFLNWKSPWPLKLLVLAILIGLLAMVAKQGGAWSMDIAELSPLPAEQREQDRRLRHQMGAPEPRYLLLHSAPTTEALLQQQEGVAPLLDEAVSRGYLDSAQWASQILPSRASQLKRQSVLPDAETLSQRLDEALLDLPFHRELFTPFIEDVAQSRDLTPLEPADLEDGSLGVRLGGLIRQEPDRAVGLIHMSDVKDPPALEQFLSESDAQWLRFVDLKQTTHRFIDGFRIETLDRISWAAGLIAVVLLIGLRNPLRGLRVLLPIVLAVGMAASLPVILGDRLNLFHLVSLMLVAGIGLDYALFFSRREGGEDRLRTLHALAVCGISTLVVFAMLAASSIPVLHAIGMTVATGVVSAFVLSWLFARQDDTPGFL